MGIVYRDNKTTSSGFLGPRDVNLSLWTYRGAPVTDCGYSSGDAIYEVCNYSHNPHGRVLLHEVHRCRKHASSERVTCDELDIRMEEKCQDLVDVNYEEMPSLLAKTSSRRDYPVEDGCGHRHERQTQYD